MATVRATETVALTPGGQVTILRKGEEYESDHPLVKQFPQFFKSDQRDEPQGKRRVEQATAAPGEVR